MSQGLHEGSQLVGRKGLLEFASVTRKRHVAPIVHVKVKSQVPSLERSGCVRAPSAFTGRKRLCDTSPRIGSGLPHFARSAHARHMLYTHSTRSTRSSGPAAHQCSLHSILPGPSHGRPLRNSPMGSGDPWSSNCASPRFHPLWSIRTLKNLEQLKVVAVFQGPCLHRIY